jgi:fructose-1,6-bisphosphatase/inositol monophosphatase family enzyme
MIAAATRTAVEAGKKIATGAFASLNPPQDWMEKDDSNVGHHAIVTPEDIRSQTLILAALSECFPEALFLTEEKQDSDPTGGRILTDRNLELLQKSAVFVVDPLDGTSFRKRRLPGWSVSVGVMNKGCHVGGAIYAPENSSGLLLMGGNAGKLRCEEPDGKVSTVSRILARARKKSIVFIGLDLHFLGQFSSFISDFSTQVQTVSSTSCALGLAYFCTGRIDALVQPVQSPWDWAAGYPLVLRAGGKFQFYHYRNGFPEPMDQPDIPSYSPTVRNTAFIAGNPRIVDWLFEMLCKNWRKL